MTQGGRKGVGGVEFFKERFGGNQQNAPQHLFHLLLRRSPVAGDGHLDFSRLIFGDRHIAHERGRHRHPLRTAEFEH